MEERTYKVDSTLKPGVGVELATSFPCQTIISRPGRDNHLRALVGQEGVPGQGRRLMKIKGTFEREKLTGHR